LTKDVGATVAFHMLIHSLPVVTGRFWNSRWKEKNIGPKFYDPLYFITWGGGMFTCCKPWIQLFADASNRRPHSVLRYH